MSASDQMLTASAAEVQRDFAAWQARAMTQPVAVTEQGEPKGLLINYRSNMVA